MLLSDSLLLHIPSYVFWKDKKSRFVGCNELFLKNIAGLDKYEDLIGKTDYELPSKKYATNYLKNDKHVLVTGETVKQVEELPLANGATIISETTKAPIKEGEKIVGILGICHDITDRIKAEELNIELARKEAIISEQNKFKNIIDRLFQVLNEYKYCGKENHQITTIELTKRENQILHYLSLNKNPKEIGLILNITGNTVQSIINKRLFVKLGVNSIGRLIEEAVRNKLISFTLDDE